MSAERAIGETESPKVRLHRMMRQAIEACNGGRDCSIAAFERAIEREDEVALERELTQPWRPAALGRLFRIVFEDMRASGHPPDAPQAGQIEDADGAHDDEGPAARSRHFRPGSGEAGDVVSQTILETYEFKTLGGMRVGDCMHQHLRDAELVGGEENLFARLLRDRVPADGKSRVRDCLMPEEVDQLRARALAQVMKNVA
jgi:hypothetical protein